ncbi:MAG TPA: ATP-binding protein [Stellaceae bacterium]|nr:ATP-binding protein [Stellaceae bacterium]
MRHDLYSVIDWFVPAVLRQPADVHERARFFVFSHFFGVPLGLVVVTYLHRIDPVAGARLWTIGLGIIAFAAYPFLLRASGWFDLLSFVSLEQFALIVLYGAYHYGGIGSPFLPWLVAVPVLLLYHLGSRTVLRGVVFLVLGLHLIAFYVVFAAGGGFPEHVRPADFTGVGLVSLFCAAAFVAMTSLYHTQLITAQRAELEREVRARRATETKLLEAKEEAERANRAKSEFLAKMSHELRTPLNAIIGFSQIIASELLGPVGTARYAGYGTDIERSGHHLLHIISEILDLAKIETGKFVLHEAEFDLVASIRDTIDLMRPLAEARGVPMRLSVPVQGLRLVGDELRVKQIMLNLLSNATKFTEGGGLIEVTLARKHGDGASITVADTGVGIPQSDLERVLKPFEQVGNVMVSNSGGTGLGLPLAHELMALHGGTLTLASAPGQGTRVTITFPEARVVGQREALAKVGG